MASGADLNADDEIAQVRARLRALETEQIALRTRLEELERLPSLWLAATAGKRRAANSDEAPACQMELFVRGHFV